MGDFIFICRSTGEDFPPLKEIDQGLAPNYYFLSRELLRLGVKSALITGGYPRYKAHEVLSKGIEIFRIRTEPKLLYIGAPYINKRSIEMFQGLRQRPNILNTHNFWNIGLQKKVQKMGIPVVLNVHGTEFGWHENARYLPLKYGRRALVERFEMGWTIRLLKKAIKYADKIIAVSERVRDDIISNVDIDEDKVVAIYNGYDPNTFYPRKTKPLRDIYNTDFVFLFVGSFTPRKGVVDMLNSMGKIRDEFNFKLLMIGDAKDAYLRYITDLIRDNRLEDKIIMKERIPNVELPKYYSAADCFVFANIGESFGKVTMESLACGCPNITTKVGTLPDIMEKAAILVRQKDPEDLANALRIMITDKKLRNRMRKAALKEIKNFTWTRSAENYLKVYESLL